MKSLLSIFLVILLVGCSQPEKKQPQLPKLVRYCVVSGRYMFDDHSYVVLRDYGIPKEITFVKQSAENKQKYGIDESEQSTSLDNMLNDMAQAKWEMVNIDSYGRKFTIVFKQER